ncbi:hypothetical protein DLAC_11725 [Tieghemostelium lacteum]|uniref:Uncharacterized protein n=1 Tax=Tieghemostelium lacteum TaxID=361077 RepID=A0A151Z7K0_TIELA|nr:hypothetical protein DLAC_11725 [Tieghemostelium lacteum]|eukprot:KYQ89943.1 hypothetical protein DLAC_11725 [Tieghemostelium lacteum]
MTIKFIAIDLGGVLFSEGKAFARKGWSLEGYDVDLLHSLMVSPPSMDLRKGIINDHQFWNEFLPTKIPPHYDVNKIKSIYYDGYLLDQDIANFIEKCKQQGIQAVAFSGNIPSRVEYLDNKYSFRKLFDKECYSYDHQATKPDVYFVEALIKVCYPKETESIKLSHGKPLEGDNLKTFSELGPSILYLDDNPKDSKPALNYNIQVFNYQRGKFDELSKFITEKGINIKL